MLINDQGELIYHAGAMKISSELFDLLKLKLKFRQNDIFLFGKTHKIPRQEAWVGDINYRYSGHTIEAQPWIPELLNLKQQVEAWCGQSFNSCLINLYSDGEKYCAWHADDEKSLGPEPMIASLSLGQSRKFLVRKKKDHRIQHTLLLQHGDLLIMRGQFQQHWQHTVPRTRRKVGERINITFRQVLSSF